jgi:uncharacterized Zn-binding protein involved in type VI secretion
MSQPAARLTDMHTCPMQTPGVPPIPHVGGPIVGPGATTALIGGLPAARVSDTCTCVGPPDVIAKGSPTVLIAGLLAARMGDLTAHGGVIAGGFPKVMIGDQGSGTGGGGMGLGAQSGRASPFNRDSQRATLQEAAQNGTPFCEECERARLAEQAPEPAPSPAMAALQAAAENGTPFCEECARAQLALDAEPPVLADRTTLTHAALAGTPFSEGSERARAALAE